VCPFEKSPFATRFGPSGPPAVPTWPLFPSSTRETLLKQNVSPASKPFWRYHVGPTAVGPVAPVVRRWKNGWDVAVNASLPAKLVPLTTQPTEIGGVWVPAYDPS